MTTKPPQHRSLGKLWGLIGYAIGKGLNRTGAIMDSLPFPVAILDRRGKIICANQLWGKPVWPAGVLDDISIEPGTNYLNACSQAVAEGLTQSDDILKGVRGICNGTLPYFGIEYPSPSPGGERLLLMTAAPLLSRTGGAVITHRDISDLKAGLSGRLINAQEEERSRVAAELHDNLSQQMALLSIDIEQIVQLPLESTAAVQEGLNRVLRTVQEISSEMQRVSYELHPSKLDRLGLPAAILALCRENSCPNSLHIECRIDNVPGDLSRDVSLCLYRVVQECLQNVIKHSGACQASVELQGSPSVVKLRITDEGVGFKPESASRKHGLGLISMRERLKLVGGTMSIESQQMRGTQIDVVVPLKATNPASAK